MIGSMRNFIHFSRLLTLQRLKSTRTVLVPFSSQKNFTSEENSITHPVYTRNDEIQHALQNSFNAIKSDQYTHNSPLSITVEEFDAYIEQPSLSVTDILSIDIRPLPLELRLQCLERVFQLTCSNRHTLLHYSSLEANSSSLQVIPNPDYWPKRYLKAEHDQRGRAWHLPVVPVNNDCFHSPQFKLLVLSICSNVQRLHPSDLLYLATRLRTVSKLFEPIVYAAVLRLLALNQLCTIASLLTRLPSSAVELTSNEHKFLQTAPGTAKCVIEQEADLLRSALATYLLANARRLLPNNDVFTLLHLHVCARDFVPASEMSNLHTLFLQAECDSLNFNPKQSSLYLFVLVCRLYTRYPSLDRLMLKRCFSQLQRKINLLHRYSDNNQSEWFLAALTAFANLHVGSGQGLASTEQHTRGDDFHSLLDLPLAALSDDLSTSGSGIDLYSILSLQWVRQIFSDLTGHVAGLSQQQQQQQQTLGHLHTSTLLTYSLALLGYRANSLMDHLLDRLAQPEVSPPATEVSLHRVFQLTRLLTEVTCDPINELDRSKLDSDLIRLLPRVEWRLYYTLIHDLATKTPSAIMKKQEDASSTAKTDLNASSPALLEPYKTVKRDLIDRIDGLLAGHKLRQYPFHCIMLTPPPSPTDDALNESPTLFADLIKLVMCFLSTPQDRIVKPPLQALVTAYRQLPSISVAVLDVETKQSDDGDSKLVRQIVEAVNKSQPIEKSSVQLNAA